MTGLREPNVVCMFLWLNVCRTGWYHLLSDTHTHRHTDMHTNTPHWFNRTVLLDFAHGHYTSTYQKNRYWVERGGGATAIKKQTRLHGTAPWQTGCPAIAPPHSVHEAAKWAGLAALLRCFRLYTEQEIPHMVESACLHSPTPSTFYTRANGKSKLDKSTSQMPVLFNIRHFFLPNLFLVCFKNLWMCSNIHKINVFFKK